MTYDRARASLPVFPLLLILVVTVTLCSCALRHLQEPSLNLGAMQPGELRVCRVVLRNRYPGMQGVSLCCAPSTAPCPSTCLPKSAVSDMT